MSDFDTEINTVLNDMRIATNLDSPDWLSEAIIQLSALNYRIGVAMAQAEFQENEATLNFLSSPPFDEGGK